MLLITNSTEVLQTINNILTYQEINNLQVVGYDLTVKSNEDILCCKGEYGLIFKGANEELIELLQETANIQGK